MRKAYTYNRREWRYSHEGTVILYTSKGKAVKARGRDLSSLGIGIEFPTKLKGYRLGAEVELEYTVPNHLRGLKIKAQLRRVFTDRKGHDHCGFAIIDDSPLVKQRIKEIISFYIKMLQR